MLKPCPLPSQNVTELGDRVFKEAVKLGKGHQSGPESNMTGVLIKRGGGDAWKYRKRTVWRQREKTAIHKTKEEASEQQPCLLTPWPWTSSLHNCEKINSCCVITQPNLWYFIYGSPSKLIQDSWHDFVWCCLAFLFPTYVANYFILPSLQASENRNGPKCGALYRGYRCKALYQGHRCGPLHQGHLWNWLSTIAIVAMSLPDLILGKNTYPLES